MQKKHGKKSKMPFLTNQALGCSINYVNDDLKKENKRKTFNMEWYAAGRLDISLYDNCVSPSYAQVGGGNTLRLGVNMKDF